MNTSKGNKVEHPILLAINPTQCVKRAIEPGDIVAMNVYETQRKTIRTMMVDYKRNRRMQVGPHSTLMFENFHTMLYQVHEMLFTEGNTPGQLDDELSAYNPLIPRGNTLSVTLMLDIADADLRRRVLLQLGGIEKTVYLRFAGHSIQAGYEQDVERTAEDGKTSSVHFLHFRFNREQVRDFKNTGERASIEIDHPNYRHMAVIPQGVKEAIIQDV